MKNWIKDFKENNFKSGFTIFKFILILMVPIIYTFTCISSFWDPLNKTENIPIAIVNEDKSSVTKNFFNNIIDNNKNLYIINKYNSKIKFKLHYLETSISKYKIDKKYWTQFIIPYTYGNDIKEFDKNFMARPNEITEKQNFDIWKKASNNINILLEGGIVKDAPPDLSSSYYKTYFGPKNGNYKNHNLLFWSSYDNNFISGQIMYLFLQFKTTFENFMIPRVIESFLMNNSKDSQGNIDKLKLENFLNNNFMNINLSFINRIFLYKITILIQSKIKNIFNNKDKITTNEFKTKFKTNVIDNLSFLSPGSAIKSEIKGNNYNNYGIGLGQFFILIGIWVGIIFQFFLYKRDRNIKNGPFKNFFLTLTNSYTISALQTTLMMLSIYAIGFYVLNTAFIFLFLLNIFISIVFSTIIVSILFIFKEADIGKFLTLLFLIMNLTSSGGTFPTIMQNKFFQIISYICPFTYGIKCQSIIIYNYNNGFINNSSITFITAFFILLIMGLLFLLLGLFLAWKNWNKIVFGTSNVKEIKDIAEKMNYKFKNYSDLYKYKFKIKEEVIALKEERVYVKKNK